MADAAEVDATLQKFLDHLGDLPEPFWHPRKRPNVVMVDHSYVSSIRPWLSELFSLAEACVPWVKTPIVGRGLDAAWMRWTFQFIDGMREVLRTQGLGEVHNRYANDVALWADRIRGVAGGVSKLRRDHTPVSLASQVEQDDRTPLDLIPSAAAAYENRWLDAGLPSRPGEGQIRKVTEYSRDQDALEDSLRQFRTDIGKLLLRAVDDLQMPDALSKDIQFCGAVHKSFRVGEVRAHVLFDRLVTEWLPSRREGYGGPGWLYPGAAEDDAKRFNLGVRRARCAAALADALAPRSAHTDELFQMAEAAAAERTSLTAATKQANERYEVFKLYDAVWLDLQNARCNPVADQPLDPNWLLERISTLVARARTLDDFDGGTGEIDRLRWLRDSPPAADHRIAKAFAVAIAAAVDGGFDRSAAEAVCGMLEEHPGNELIALYRAYPDHDNRPRFKPMKTPTAAKPHEQVSTVAWLISQLGSVEWYTQRAADFGAKIVGPVLKGSVEEHYRAKQREEAAGRDDYKKRIAETAGTEELRAWLNYHDISWTRAAVEKQRDRLFVEQGLSRADADALALDEFLNRLRDASSSGNKEPNGTDDDFIKRLLDGPNDTELSAREMAYLEAHLKQKYRLSTVQQERRETGESAT